LIQDKEKLREQELASKRQVSKDAAASKAAAAEQLTTSTTESNTGTLSTNPEGEGEDTTETETWNIAPEEVVRRLRARGHPIRLFAETDKERKIRLRALELVEDRSEGQRNDFMRALENAETGLHMEALGRQEEEKQKKTKEDPSKNVVSFSFFVIFFFMDNVEDMTSKRTSGFIH